MGSCASWLLHIFIFVGSNVTREEEIIKRHMVHILYLVLFFVPLQEVNTIKQGHEILYYDVQHSSFPSTISCLKDKIVACV